MQKTKVKDTINGKMKIGQLAKDCRVNKSTIHHYLNIGLLHEPQRLGSTSALYDESHFRRLKQITQLRKEQKLPLTMIKNILDGHSARSDKGENEGEFQNRVITAHQKEAESKEVVFKEKRNQIMDAAMRAFNKKGYESTTIKDIMDSIQKASSTFYLYFDSKEELFKECMKRMTIIAVPEEEWDAIRNERDFDKRSRIRGSAFLKAFPTYSGVLNLVKSALVGDNPKLAERAKETLEIMTRPLVKDMQQGIAEGRLREVDTEKVSYLLLGMAEMLGHFLSINPQYPLEEAVTMMHDFFLDGLIKRDDNGKARPISRYHPDKSRKR